MKTVQIFHYDYNGYAGVHEWTRYTDSKTWELTHRGRWVSPKWATSYSGTVKIV